MELPGAPQSVRVADMSPAGFRLVVSTADLHVHATSIRTKVLTTAAEGGGGRGGAGYLLQTVTASITPGKAEVSKALSLACGGAYRLLISACNAHASCGEPTTLDVFLECAPPPPPPVQPPPSPSLPIIGQGEENVTAGSSSSSTTLIIAVSVAVSIILAVALLLLLLCRRARVKAGRSMLAATNKKPSKHRRIDLRRTTKERVRIEQQDPHLMGLLIIT